MALTDAEKVLAIQLWGDSNEWNGDDIYIYNSTESLRATCNYLYKFAPVDRLQGINYTTVFEGDFGHGVRSYLVGRATSGSEVTFLDSDSVFNVGLGD